MIDNIKMKIENDENLSKPLENSNDDEKYILSPKIPFKKVIHVKDKQNKIIKEFHLKSF